MTKPTEWLFPTAERRIVGWFTAAAALVGLLAGVLVYAQPGIDETLVFWLPGEPAWWYTGFAVTSFLIVHAFIRFSRRRGGPVSIWLAPAFAAAWAALGPLLDYVLARRADVSSFAGAWWNLLPLAVMLAPALIATVQENEPGAPLLPSEERRQALAIGWLALALYLANKVVFTSPQWAGPWLPRMSDEEELGYLLLLVTLAPLLICLVAVLGFRAPRSAWIAPAAGALTVAFAAGLPGTLAGPEFAGSLTLVLLTIPMCLMALIGSAIGAALTPLRQRRSG